MTIYRLFVNAKSGREGLLNVVAFVVALLTALILHEIAHGLVALWNGDNTAKLYGRLTLNPLKHFDWVGLLMMFIVGFGWARPVPVNPNNFKNRKVGAITVSVAGVLTNLIIAFLAAMGKVAIGQIDVAGMSESMYYFTYFCYELMSLLLTLNVTFALFNILPLYPLDGYRLLSCFVNENNRVMVFLRKYSLYILLGLIAIDYLFEYVTVIPNCSPLNWYLSEFGGLIQTGFLKFWGLIF